jgi:large subunit ribosomal protein L22
MHYVATAKYVRMSPRKVRLVARAIIGQKVDVALAALSSVSKYAAEPLRKAIGAALDSAKQKNAAVDSLKISSIDVMGGPAMKRWHAASRGMAHPYKKRMTHIKVVLEVKEKGLPAQAGK